MDCRVIHFEIGCRDRGLTSEFYRSLFDWEMDAQAMSTQIRIAAADAITGHIVSLGHEPHHYTIFYVQVEDVGRYLARANELGGKTLVPPIKIPMGTFAWLADIDGNTIGLLQPAV